MSAADKFAADAAHAARGRLRPAFPPAGWVWMPVRSLARSSRESILRAKTIIWNGPPGVFEFRPRSPARHEGHGRGDCPGDRGGRHDRRRRRRHRHRGQEVQGRGQGHPLFHRWRRQPRIPRGQGAARRGPIWKAEQTRPCSHAMRKKLIAGNWKMNKTPTDAIPLVKDIVAAVGQRHNVDVVICPPFTALESVARALEGSAVKLGAQNMHPEPSGAYTGEVSALMLRALFASHVILGHSERRTLFQGDRRLHQPEGARGAQEPAKADPLRWRNAAGTRSRRDAEGRADPARAGSRGRGKGHRHERRHRLRAGLGDRHGQGCHDRAGAGGACIHPQPADEHFWRGRSRRRSASSMADR